MRINLGSGSRIEQSMHIHLADVSRAPIIVRLSSKAVRRARVVRALSCECCGGYDVRGTGRTYSRSRRNQQCDRNRETSAMHWSSGAEVEPRILLRIWDQPRKGTPACKFPGTGILSLVTTRNCGQLMRSIKETTDHLGRRPSGRMSTRHSRKTIVMSITNEL